MIAGIARERHLVPTVLNVLIVEDVVETALWLKQTIESVFTKSSVTLCHSIEDARIKLEYEKFSIALIDINLPDGSRIFLIKDIKELHKDTVVVTVTNYDDDHVFDAIRTVLAVIF